MRASKVIFAAGLTTLSALTAPGCGAPPAREEPGIDCSVTDAYDTHSEVPDAWFSAPDDTGQVTCSSLLALLPDDMTSWEVAKRMWPVMTQPPLCRNRTRCDASDAVLPDPLPEGPLDRQLCEIFVPEQATVVPPATLPCDSLSFPEDMSDEEFAALLEPLVVQPAGPKCEPRVLCDDRYAILPAPDSTRPLGEQFCPSSYARRAVAAIDSAAPLAEGERCNGTDAIHLTASRNNDWGCVFGNYELAKQQIDRSDYDGVGLWAKAAPGTTKTIIIVLEDKYSTNIRDDNGILSTAWESACIDEEGGGTVSGTPDQNGQQGSGTAVIGYVPSPNACGNGYQAQLAVTDRWQFYFLPWKAFTQDPLPNRRIEGIDPSSLRGLVIRAPKQAVLDLWIDDLGYYDKVE